MTETVFKFWIASLKDYSFQEIVDAFNRFVQTESRMPVLADILKILRGSEEDRALAALLKVERAMEEHGGYATVVFDDPVIHATIQSLGGWLKACRQTDYDFTWWKKEFRERYRHFDQYGLPPEVPVRLVGIFDQANLPLGNNPQKPAVIGNYEKAIEWVSKMEETRSLSSETKHLKLSKNSKMVFKNNI